MTISSETAVNPTLNLAILVLAAGEGSRLGGYPKALLKKEGESLLARFCKATQDLHAVEILIVTGFYADRIQEEIGLIARKYCMPLHWVCNPHPEVGQASSVRLGIESLRSDYDVLLIALCDQPLIGIAEITLLLEQFKQKTAGQEIILPMINGQRGNPVLFSRKVIQDILATPEMVCRTYMDQFPELVKIVESSNSAYIADVDTPDDLQKYGFDRI